MVDAATTAAELRNRVGRFVRDREWERFHGPKDLAIALSIEASELLERFLWKPNDSATRLSPEDRHGIGEELADVLIYGLSLANAIGLDVSDAVLAKLAQDEAKYPADAYRGRAP